VAWTFLDNPFFGPATFEKAYVFSCAGGNENLLDLKVCVTRQARS
jgi:hypothetical protein